MVIDTLVFAYALLGVEELRQDASAKSKYSNQVILMDAASREAVGPLGTPRREWQALAKRRNNADGRFPARPQGATQMIQYGVAALEKGLPFSASCALSWIIWIALHPSI